MAKNLGAFTSLFNHLTPFPQTLRLLVRIAKMDFGDMISIPAESRNETVSDIPGPGRLLGKVYAKLGRNLEAVLNLAAHSVGTGPVSTAKEIEGLAQMLKGTSCENKVIVMKLEEKLKKSCKVLVKYTRCVRCIAHTDHN